MTGVSSSDPPGSRGTTENTLDLDDLRAKYAEERSKRLRADGIGQYTGLAGPYAHFAEDPWVGPLPDRSPCHEQVDVVVLGAGFSGLMTAVALHQGGIRNIRIVDKAGDVGGTWYWNRYPGVRCDTEAYIYLPLLEETGYVPTEKYVTGREILEHARRIARHYDLYPRAYLRTQITSATWSEDDRRWIVRTDREDVIEARFLVLASGIFNAAKLPDLPGINEFEGRTFHTSRWDYVHSGGSPESALDRLSDARVGVIGTGASAVQLIPPLARDVGHLYVFQRTPALVAERNNRPTDPAWFAKLERGWWHTRNQNFLEVQQGLTDLDLIDDGWTELFKARSMLLGEREGGEPQSGAATAAEAADFAYGERLRRRVDATVEDHEVATRLKAWYGQWCKRPLFHDEYLDVFNRANVTLVDTDGSGVERITPGGVVCANVEYELDCLVFASGFEVGTPYTRRTGIELVGRDERRLSEHWADTVSTFQRCMTNGFPNCFFVGLMESLGPAPNFVYAAHQLAIHVAWLVQTAVDRGATLVAVTESAEAEFQRMLGEQPAGYADYQSRCTPGYFNAEGAGLRLGASHYPGGQLAYFDYVERWRRAGTFDGIVLE